MDNNLVKATARSILTFVAALLFIGCSPCHRIQRLSAKHPECFKALTETKHDTGGVKIAPRDSFTRANDRAIDNARDTFNKIVYVLTDCNSTRDEKEKAVTRVNDALTRAKETTRANTENIPCLKDTVTFHDKGGAILKLWQSGDQIKYSLDYPTVKYQVAEKHWPWYVWFLIGFGLCFILYTFGLLRLGR